MWIGCTSAGIILIFLFPCVQRRSRSERLGLDTQLLATLYPIGLVLALARLVIFNRMVRYSILPA